MKKKLFFKFFVFAVLGALISMSSCKDYDEDISRLDGEIVKAKSELSTELSQLRTELNSAIDKKVGDLADDLAAAQTQLNNLQAAAATKAELDAAKADILSKTVALATFNEFKTTNAAELAALAGRITAIEANYATKAELTALGNRVGTLELNSATKAELQAAKSELQANIDALSANVAATYATKTALANAVAALEDVDAALQGQINTLDGRVDVLEADLEDLDDAFTTFKNDATTKLGSLQDQLDAMDVRVGDLEDLYADLKKQHDDDVLDLIDRIAKLKAELNPRITVIETLLEISEGKSGTLDRLAKGIADNLEAIGANKDAIKALREDMEDSLAYHLGLIQANQTAIGQLRTDLTATGERLDSVITKALPALQTQITTNADDISKINKYIDETLEPRLDDIETAIDDLEDDLNLKITSLFTLVTNRLSAITLASNLYVGGVEAIEFITFNYRELKPGDGNWEWKTTTYPYSIGAPTTASYWFNPRTFKLANADYQYIDRQAKVRAADALPESNLVEIIGDPFYKAADATVNFPLRRINTHTTQPKGGKENFVVLQATMKDKAVAEDEVGAVVIAHQELVFDDIFNNDDICITDKDEDCEEPECYPTTYAAAKSGKIWYTDWQWNLVYNLKEKVKTCRGGTGEIDLDDFGLSYKFSLPSTPYNITTGETVTDQQEWIELVDGDEGLYQSEGFNKEAIGRTPILKVELVDSEGRIVRRAFVKVEITTPKAPDITVGKSFDLVYECAEDEASFELNEHFIRENVYRVIANFFNEASMSHEEFWNLYDWENPVNTVTKTPASIAANTLPMAEIVSGATGTGTATKKIVWEFDHGDIGKVGSGAVLKATVTVKNKISTSSYPSAVTFTITVNVKSPTLPAANKDFVENDTYWSKNADGSYKWYNANVSIPTNPQSPAEECYFSTSLPQAYSKYIFNFVPDIDCYETYYRISSTYSNGAKTNPKLSGVKISGDNIELEKDNAAIETALNSPKGLQAVVEHVLIFDSGDEIVINNFMVNFIRPVNLNMPGNVEVTDAVDDGDTVTFGWGGLLTDWRGKPIIPPTTDVEDQCEGEWVENPIPVYEWVEGYYNEVSPASLDVEYGEVEFMVCCGQEVTMITGTRSWTVQTRTWGGHHGWGGWSGWGTCTDTGGPWTGTLEAGPYQTEAEVDTDLAAQALEINVPTNTTNQEYQLILWPTTYDEVTVTTEGQLIKYTYVKSFTYTPAVYEWIPGGMQEVVVEPTEQPEEPGTENGDRSGEWEWVVTCTEVDVDVPGQYWDFYGEFGEFVVDFGTDFSNVTTNLEYNGFKLPTNVTLEQIDETTIRYINVGAPVGYVYEIYLPVTITYGWGQVSTTLTLVVNPVN